MSTPVKIDKAVSIEEIVNDVRERGDVAVSEWSAKFDATTSATPERAVAYGDIPTAAVLAAAEAVRTWHAAQRPADLMMEVSPGVTLERRWSPLRSVGIYVPKGLVSSLIMTAVPAQVAGVERIVVCTPPNGSAAVAATAALLGIDEVWAIGGAQAIAAMAYGTDSIAPVDKIFGPGSGAVNTAKLLVSRDVAIDLPAGPSEIVVVADEGIDEALIAQEIAAQMGTRSRLPGIRRARGRRSRGGSGGSRRLRRRTRGSAGRTGGVLGRSHSKRRRCLCRTVLAGARGRLRDRREPRSPDRRLGQVHRRARSRRFHENGHRATGHQGGTRATSSDH